jgi:probable rRNA maturation factor
MIEISITSDHKFGLKPAELQLLADQILTLAGATPGSALSVQVTGDETLQRLNREYLGIDAPTDVLSFPVPFDDPESGSHYLGDILISLPTAARQADSGGHPVEEEVKLLLVHGILHLLGHDHAKPEEKAAMWHKQDEILAALGINIRPTE